MKHGKADLKRGFERRLRPSRIFATQGTALRHGSINLTREYHIDKKQPAVFQVSKLLEETAIQEARR